MLAVGITNLEFQPVMGPLWAAGVAAALAAVVFWVAARWPAPVSRGRRGALLVLRLLVVAAVLALLVRPVVRWEGTRPAMNEVAVLIDGSRSMGIRDAGAATAVTRAEAVRQAFAGAAKPYAQLAAKALISPYAFGTRTRLIDRLAAEPADPRTDISEALEKVSGTSFAHLAAVVLVSDGRANRSQGSAEETARRLAARGVAVHAVAVGSEKPTDRVRDVAVHDVRAPERVFVGNRPEVRATVATLGLAGKPIEAVLTLNDKEVDRRRLTPASNRTTQELVFTPTVEKAGPARIALSVAPLEGELITTNNRAATTVRVEEGGIRVLYLDGRLHPEGKYLARVLGAAKELMLDRRILAGGAGAAVPQPADLDAFSIVILGDVPASALPQATIARLAERVREGKLGVLTLGGLSAYGAGRWAATPLAEVLPVEISDGDGQVAGPIRLRPTAAGGRHFIFGGGPGDGAMNFGALPAMAGASAVRSVRPTAQCLAESEDGKPLLAVREFAQGRVASLMVDTTWQWVLAPAETGGAETHRRFWRQLILWVAGRDGRPQAELWVMADRSRYVVSDPQDPPVAEITACVKGGGTPRVRLDGPVEQDVPLERRGGDWSGLVALRAPGEYKVLAEAQIGGQTARAETSLVVEEQDFELAEVLADHALLRKIAEAGGGTFRPVEDLPKLLADLAAGLRPLSVPAERCLSLAGGRVFLGCVLTLLAAEWVLRRRWGMV